MEAFNFNRLRDLIPTELPKLPGWSTTHDSMNPEDEIDVSDDEEQRPSSMIIMSPDPVTHNGPRSYLDLINECDNFPYYQTDAKLFFAHINTYYGFYVASHPTVELGYILPSVAAVFRGLPDWAVNDDDRTLTLTTGSTADERSRVMAATCDAMRATGHFKILDGWRDELYPVYGPQQELLFSVERAASALFGVVTYGCHMTAYTEEDDKNDGENDETTVVGGRRIKIWVPRRAKTKSTYGGMLDNTAAGGIATGEKPFESMVREAGEEASLPDELVRKQTHAAGTVTYFHIRDHRAGGETRLLQPECQYVYDLPLPKDVIPKPCDDEVESFELMTVDEVKDAMRAGQFKPNCALVLIDFFIRHGIITAEDEGYIEMVARLHRKFEFPTL